MLGSNLTEMLTIMLFPAPSYNVATSMLGKNVSSTYAKKFII